MNYLSYDEKKRYADRYLIGLVGIGWNDLGDINSLHDAENKQGIEELCHERLEDSGCPMEELGL